MSNQNQLKMAVPTTGIGIEIRPNDVSLPMKEPPKSFKSVKNHTTPTQAMPAQMGSFRIGKKTER